MFSPPRKLFEALAFVLKKHRKLTHCSWLHGFYWLLSSHLPWHCELDSNFSLISIPDLKTPRIHSQEPGLQYDIGTPIRVAIPANTKAIQPSQLRLSIPSHFLPPSPQPSPNPYTLPQTLPRPQSSPSSLHRLVLPKP
jgi:hypothetical protein